MQDGPSLPEQYAIEELAALGHRPTDEKVSDFRRVEAAFAAFESGWQECKLIRIYVSCRVHPKVTIVKRELPSPDQDQPTQKGVSTIAAEAPPDDSTYPNGDGWTWCFGWGECQTCFVVECTPV